MKNPKLQILKDLNLGFFYYRESMLFRGNRDNNIL